MLTTDEARALAILSALVALGAGLAWIDARHPRILALTLGDSLALGVPGGDPGAPAESVGAGPAARAAAAPSTAPPAVAPGEPPGGPGAAGGGAYTADGRLDLNRATAEELESLPGIGPKTAERIVSDRRARGRFRSVRDLGRVKGIGPKTLARLEPHVAAGSAPLARPEASAGSTGAKGPP